MGPRCRRGNRVQAHRIVNRLSAHHGRRAGQGEFHIQRGCPLGSRFPRALPLRAPADRGSCKLADNSTLGRRDTSRSHPELAPHTSPWFRQRQRRCQIFRQWPRPRCSPGRRLSTERPQRRQLSTVRPRRRQSPTVRPRPRQLLTVRPRRRPWPKPQHHPAPFPSPLFQVRLRMNRRRQPARLDPPRTCRNCTCTQRGPPSQRLRPVRAVLGLLRGSWYLRTAVDRARPCETAAPCLCRQSSRDSKGGLAATSTS
jgi:hypothetical protein